MVVFLGFYIEIECDESVVGLLECEFDLLWELDFDRFRAGYLITAVLAPRTAVFVCVFCANPFFLFVRIGIFCCFAFAPYFEFARLSFVVFE